MYNNCNICESSDKKLENYVRELPVETSFHRVERQEVRCGFGLQGICCRLCANGPCRIMADRPRGVCGADADTIVSRNFLRAVAAGSGCYIHVLENSIKILKKTAKARGHLGSAAAVKRLAGILGVEMGDDLHETAYQIAERIRMDLIRDSDEPMEIIKNLALGQRYELWERIGILPGGAKSEILDGIVKTSTNLSSDCADMLMHCLRLGISTGMYGLLLTNLIHDILIGEPEIHAGKSGFHVIDPDYINIMVTGHQESLYQKLQEKMNSAALLQKAGQAGAKGFRLIGCTCVGQDMQTRQSCYGDAYAGHAGNNFVSEAVLATGAVDGVVSEFNCTLPGIEAICEKLKIRMICLDEMAKKTGALLVKYDYNKADIQTEQILEQILEAYRDRRGHIEIRELPDHGNEEGITGVNELTLKAMLGGTWEPLLELIKKGSIKGIVGVVGCSSVSYGHDTLTVSLVKELIKRDILVLTAGCTSGGLANCGLTVPEAASQAGSSLQDVCRTLHIPPVLNFGSCLTIGRMEMVASELAGALGVDIPQLPLALSAAQWLEEQALADGAYGLALGLTVHLGVPPFITGSSIVTETLTEGLEALTGGKVIVNPDGAETAAQLEAVIMQKRSGLGI